MWAPRTLSSLIRGSLILLFIGARIPFSERVPLRTCLTATAQGMPTGNWLANRNLLFGCGVAYRAWPWPSSRWAPCCRTRRGSRSGSAWCRPSARPRTCAGDCAGCQHHSAKYHAHWGPFTYMTMSRSPSANCIFCSRVPQSVSRWFPRGTICTSELTFAPVSLLPDRPRVARDAQSRDGGESLTFAVEKRPSHLRPARMRCLSPSSLKVTLESTAAMRSFSLDDAAPSIFWKTSFQGATSLQ